MVFNFRALNSPYFSHVTASQTVPVCVSRKFIKEKIAHTVMSVRNRSKQQNCYKHYHNKNELRSTAELSKNKLSETNNDSEDEVGSTGSLESNHEIVFYTDDEADDEDSSFNLTGEIGLSSNDSDEVISCFYFFVKSPYEFKTKHLFQMSAV